MVFGTKTDPVAYKDSRVAILIHMVGAQKEFYREFSNLTAEDYELKSVFQPTSSFLGIGGGPMAFCYFQKLKKQNFYANSIKTPESKDVTFVDMAEEREIICASCGRSSTGKICVHCKKELV